ncbi:hypothetical protein RHMOL_Rhmol02G0210800 [Rhododendron molle]|uniref:Uncharacterized protein n=1 Tax=Rhododendron molle TaxID=49168 RepID=A0ACC0PS52_RHOML|nr:hypothetical protein RHMOL_Rhmol02G0210800 [Rhododendron molle]
MKRFWDFSKQVSSPLAGRRRKKGKSAIYRSAVAALALSVSISEGGIANRNRILLNEAQAAWTLNKIMGLKYDGDEDR